MKARHSLVFLVIALLCTGCGGGGGSTTTHNRGANIDDTTLSIGISGKATPISSTNPLLMQPGLLQADLRSSGIIITPYPGPSKNPNQPIKTQALANQQMITIHNTSVEEITHLKLVITDTNSKLSSTAALPFTIDSNCKNASIAAKGTCTVMFYDAKNNNSSEQQFNLTVAFDKANMPYTTSLIKNSIVIAQPWVTIKVASDYPGKNAVDPVVAAFDPDSRKAAIKVALTNPSSASRGPVFLKEITDPNLADTTSNGVKILQCNQVSNGHNCFGFVDYPLSSALSSSSTPTLRLCKAMTPDMADANVAFDKNFGCYMWYRTTGDTSRSPGAMSASKSVSVLVSSIVNNTTAYQRIAESFYFSSQQALIAGGQNLSINAGKKDASASTNYYNVAKYDCDNPTDPTSCQWKSLGAGSATQDHTVPGGVYALIKDSNGGLYAGGNFTENGTSYKVAKYGFYSQHGVYSQPTTTQQWVDMNSKDFIAAQANPVDVVYALAMTTDLKFTGGKLLPLMISGGYSQNTLIAGGRFSLSNLSGIDSDCTAPASTDAPFVNIAYLPLNDTRGNGGYSNSNFSPPSPPVAGGKPVTWTPLGVYVPASSSAVDASATLPTCTYGLSDLPPPSSSLQSSLTELGDTAGAPMPQVNTLLLDPSSCVSSSSVCTNNSKNDLPLYSADKLYAGGIFGALVDPASKKTPHQSGLAKYDGQKNSHEWIDYAHALYSDTNVSFSGSDAVHALGLVGPEVDDNAALPGSNLLFGGQYADSAPYQLGIMGPSLSKGEQYVKTFEPLTGPVTAATVADKAPDEKNPPTTLTSNVYVAYSSSKGSGSSAGTFLCLHPNMKVPSSTSGIASASSLSCFNIMNGRKVDLEQGQFVVNALLAKEYKSGNNSVYVGGNDLESINNIKGGNPLASCNSGCGVAKYDPGTGESGTGKWSFVTGLSGNVRALLLMPVVTIQPVSPANSMALPEPKIKAALKNK